VQFRLTEHADPVGGQDAMGRARSRVLRNPDPGREEAGAVVSGRDARTAAGLPEKIREVKAST